MDKKKWGKILMVVGAIMFVGNIITYGLWEIDIDIIGAALFIIGLVTYIIGKVKG